VPQAALQVPRIMTWCWASGSCWRARALALCRRQLAPSPPRLGQARGRQPASQATRWWQEAARPALSRWCLAGLKQHTLLPLAAPAAPALTPGLEAWPLPHGLPLLRPVVALAVPTSTTRHVRKLATTLRSAPSPAVVAAAVSPLRCPGPGPALLATVDPVAAATLPLRVEYCRLTQVQQALLPSRQACGAAPVGHLLPRAVSAPVRVHWHCQPRYQGVRLWRGGDMSTPAIAIPLVAVANLPQVRAPLTLWIWRHAV
jgi:hypothetical protein